MKFVGTRWYKCDFHLHTMKSPCYKDKTNTVSEWIDKVKQQGLECIAVTDHNDYRAIDEMKDTGAKEGIIVFPGVELTCDTSKIHILIIFDSNKSSENVRDFLSKVDIDSDLVGKDIGTQMNVFDVCKIAKDKGALVIAAHIDEYSSISSMSAANIEKILNRKYIDAVQVVNQCIWGQYSVDKNKENMLKSLQEKYENVSLETAEEWRKTYDKAVKAKIPMLTFSDNPCGNSESKHGLWGIGAQYTWIKMDQNPNLESIRQAFLADDVRVKLYNESIPDILPDLWIKAMYIENTTINPYVPIKVDFNPQLNSIIGGRGSGKSSIIRILAGALNSINSYELEEIKAEQDKFYKGHSARDSTGIFGKNSKVEIELIRNSEHYKVVVKNVKNMGEQERTLLKYDEIKDDWNKVDDENYLDFMKIQAYTQKQIFEIAKEPDALLKIIDQDVDGIEDALDNKNSIRNNLLAQIGEIREVEKKISSEGKIISELKDLQEQIEYYKKSGMADLLEAKLKFSKESKLIGDYFKSTELLITQLEDGIVNVVMPELKSDNMPEDVKVLISNNHRILTEKMEGLKSMIEEMKKQNLSVKSSIENSKWKRAYIENINQYQESRELLINEGVMVDKLDELLIVQKRKQMELETINQLKAELSKFEKRKDKLIKEYEQAYSKIRKMRQDFVDSILTDKDNVKIEYKKHGSRSSFENMIKSLTQKDNATVAEDIAKFEEIVFDKKGIEEFRSIIREIRNGNEVKNISAILKKAIMSMEDSLYDKMCIFLPEDELCVSYRPEGARKFIPLSTASAGQKTTAILTFILAYGKIPLLLDQPEDDLDNRLVYDLVVKRLKEAKQKRQIIVVTHNANIPVNGDAEYITSMDSESRHVKKKYNGTLDSEEIRKEICDVMEGTEYAFEMRAKKYHLKIIE